MKNHFHFVVFCFFIVIKVIFVSYWLLSVVQNQSAVEQITMCVYKCADKVMKIAFFYR